MATQKQIAEMTGVSQGTVSKVLRGQIPRNMSKAKIDAILKAAEEIGYTQPKAKPQKPASPAKPKRAPSPKFGATPQGDPLHKYGKQWRQAVAADTGVMPKGDFTSLKLGEQRQVMRVLNNIDKGTGKQTAISKKNLKANQAANQIWKGVALGAGAVGIPLSIAGLVNTFTDLVESSADTARFATTAGIDPDKLIAMTRQAETYGVDAGGFKAGIASIQSLSTQLRTRQNQRLLEPFAQLGISTPLGEVENQAISGDAMGVLGAINKAYQKGEIKPQDLTELMRGLGADAFTSLIASGKFSEVASAKETKGAGDAAIDLSNKLKTLEHKFQDVFIDKFEDINKGLDKFLKWFDETDFERIATLFGNVANAMEYLLNEMGFKTKGGLLKEREQLVDRRASLEYSLEHIKDPRRRASYKSSIRGVNKQIAELDKELKIDFGYNPKVLSSAAKENSDGLVKSVQSSRTSNSKVEVTVNHNITSDGNLTDNQVELIAKTSKEVIDAKLKSELGAISENYGG